MGKLGRFACIFAPMAMTMISLVCLVIVGVGGTNKDSDVSNSLYFFKANTSDINLNANARKNLGLPDNALTDALFNQSSDVITDAATKALGIKDFYHVGLWNYCAGNYKRNGSGDLSEEDVTFCSDRKAKFWFNPVEVWHLNNSVTDKFFDDKLKDGLKAYQTVSKWMYVAYVVAVIATAAEVLVGITALFSRVGSLATTIVSTVSSIFVIGFALTATILYAALKTAFNEALKDYHIHGDMGRTMYIWAWLAVAFSWAAGIFWLFSSCCCSGRSDRIKGYNDKSGGTKYQRMPSPMPPFQPDYQGQQHGVALNNMGGKNTAYEPFRHNV